MEFYTLHYRLRAGTLSLENKAIFFQKIFPFSKLGQAGFPSVQWTVDDPAPVFIDFIS